MNWIKLLLKKLILLLIAEILFVRISYSLTWPVEGYYGITSTHGEFRDARRTHKGIDISCPDGTPVRATISGNAIIDGSSTDREGYWVKIGTHFFAHLREHDPSIIGNNKYVTEGDIIGYSSNTCLPNPEKPWIQYPYHLHFGMGDENPLLYFKIPDTNNGVIGELYFKSVDKLLVLKDGMIFNKSNPFPVSGEFIVKAYDISNTGSNHVNFYKIVSTIDNKVLKEWEFNVSHTDEASLIYSISNPTSTISNFYYRMGEWLSKEGKHFLTIEGYDLNNSTPRFSAGKTIKFIIDYTPPQIGLKEPPDIIWVPQSEWPGGDYKSSINYPVKISFDAIDNVAVDDVYAYVDGKLVGRWEDLESDISLSTTTLCGWNKHTLTITATDLAGNTTGLIY
jgi:murein DD-endopeptidase MepM/ murein hydrolase activator NlpD